MSNRIELNEQDLNDVVGGAFHYNTKPDGSMTCRVDHVNKTFNCTENAKNKISIYIMNHDDCTLQDIIDFAIQNGYFWE